MPVVHHPMPRRGPLYRAVLHYARTLHTYASMLATVLFLFFATTGFLLNHPAWFGIDNTQTTESDSVIPASVITAKDKLGLVEFLRTHGAIGAVDPFEWADDGQPFHVAFKSPKAQCDADITLPGGQTHLNIETHGVLGRLTRLHTAKDAGPVWRLLLDATATLLAFASITGLILWQSLPKRRVLGLTAIGLSIAAIALAYWLCVP